MLVEDNMNKVKIDKIPTTNGKAVVEGLVILYTPFLLTITGSDKKLTSKFLSNYRVDTKSSTLLEIILSKPVVTD